MSYRNHLIPLGVENNYLLRTFRYDQVPESVKGAFHGMFSDHKFVVFIQTDYKSSVNVNTLAIDSLQQCISILQRNRQ